MDLMYLRDNHNRIKREKSFKLKDHLVTSFWTRIHGGKQNAIPVQSVVKEAVLQKL